MIHYLFLLLSLLLIFSAFFFYKKSPAFSRLFNNGNEDKKLTRNIKKIAFIYVLLGIISFLLFFLENTTFDTIFLIILLLLSAFSSIFLTKNS